jgi:predicted aspartyl protease
MECKEQQRRRPQTEETPIKYAARHLSTRRRKHRRNQKRAYLGVNTSNKEAGMYIDLKINDVPAKFLVDTGATISLVSNKIFYALDKSKRPEVRQLRQTIVTANGTNLSSIGQSLFNLKMGNQQCGIEAVIADLAIDPQDGKSAVWD